MEQHVRLELRVAHLSVPEEREQEAIRAPAPSCPLPVKHKGTSDTSGVVGIQTLGEAKTTGFRCKHDAAAAAAAASLSHLLCLAAAEHTRNLCIRQLICRINARNAGQTRT